ncbi:DMT family transporter [Paenibacillus aceti]|uniref:Membrane protein n=1 Tax=Paenibacillus aceti TaxID=1820010 RepID=A0ABQ1W1B4_9BACL|nr:DMT family transporter [Paenibacillus aceti]GGG09361.1 membrane protein [Paenibacillus aceti]
METIFFILLTVIAGVFFPLQSGFNAELRRNVGSPYLSGGISNLIGAAIMIFIGFLFRKQIPMLVPHTSAGNWWMWGGGVLSAVIVTTMIVAPVRIGYATFISILLSGQIIMAMIIDHFGLFGSDVTPISLRHILGALLLIAGIVLIKK